MSHSNILVVCYNDEGMYNCMVKIIGSIDWKSKYQVCWSNNKIIEVLPNGNSKVYFFKLLDHDLVKYLHSVVFHEVLFNGPISLSTKEEIKSFAGIPESKTSTKNEIGLDISSLSRLEVIDNTGRALVKYLKESETFEFSLQDQGRTLKIFVK